jgi:DedD protein
LTVNSRYHNHTDLDELHEPADREISLGTSTILAIFFALALLLAIFFAFGYSLGRRSVPSAPAAPEAASSLTSNGSKPSPGSPSAASKPETDATASDEPDTEPAPSSRTAKTVALTPVASTTEPSAKPTAQAAALTTRPSPAPAIAPPAPATAGSALVQVAAVSHPEDADVLLSALKKRGYSVSIRHEPQDKLLHVQIGPFASKKDAEAMRQKLLADGYNAIVK